MYPRENTAYYNFSFFYPKPFDSSLIFYIAKNVLHYYDTHATHMQLYVLSSHCYNVC